MSVVVDFTDQARCDTLGLFLRLFYIYIRDLVGPYMQNLVTVTFTKTK